MVSEQSPESCGVHAEVLELVLAETTKPPSDARGEHQLQHKASKN